MFEILFVLLWIGFSVKIAMKGSKHKIGFNCTLILCILLTPIIANYIVNDSPEIKLDNTINEHGKIYRVQRN